MRDLQVGDKVTTTESDIIRTIIEFDENTCGDGCCSGYRLDGDGNLYYWSSDLTLVEKVDNLKLGKTGK